jgi:hypothetical protein
MSLLNFPNCRAMGITTFSPVTGASNFTVIPPLKSQVGIFFYSGSTGIEIAGMGTSYAPAGATLVNGVTMTFNNLNSNGSSLQLVANGKGLPIFVTTLDGRAFAGQPTTWISASGASLLLTVGFIYNDEFSNGNNGSNG